MRKSKDITVAERKITAEELTVEQVTNIMDGLQTATTDAFDLLFPDRLPSVAVCQSTGLTVVELKGMAPSELDAIWKATEEVNSFFVAMVGRLSSLGAAALAAGDLSAMTLK
ncbi:MAG: hypothetical protein AB7D06_17240 [Pedobacter sp.]